MKVIIMKYNVIYSLISVTLKREYRKSSKLMMIKDGIKIFSINY